MNTPTHIVCGACLAQALALSLSRARHSKVHILAVAAGALCAGILSHLLVDLLPHYNWIVYLPWATGLPFHWLIREAVFSLAVAIPAFILARGLRPYVAIGMLGAIYPDVEKVLSFDFHVPDRFILFDWHSTRFSNRTAGLPNAILIGIECLLIAASLLAMWRMRRAATNKGADASASAGEDRVRL